jgi:hypothetical protein
MFGDGVTDFLLNLLLFDLSKKKRCVAPIFAKEQLLKTKIAENFVYQYRFFLVIITAFARGIVIFFDRRHVMSCSLLSGSVNERDMERKQYYPTG